MAIIINFFLYFTIKFLKNASLKFSYIVGLVLTVGLLIYSRGSSVFLLPLLFLFSVFHFIKYKNSKVNYLLLFLIVLFLVCFYSILEIRTGYMIDWQFKKIIPTITVNKLMLFLITISFFGYLVYYFVGKYNEKINFSKFLFFILVFIKIFIAFYFSLKYTNYSFFEQLFFKEFSFMKDHFGIICSAFIIFGFFIVFLKSFRGNTEYLYLLSFYIFLSIPLTKMSVTTERVHDLFLYWHRYYFLKYF